MGLPPRSTPSTVQRSTQLRRPRFKRFGHDALHAVRLLPHRRTLAGWKHAQPPQDGRYSAVTAPEVGDANLFQGALVVRVSDDEDAPPLFLRKADGSTVYATRDLAAAIERFEKYGFTRALYVIDRGQALAVGQLHLVDDVLGLHVLRRTEGLRVWGLTMRTGAKRRSERAGPWHHGPECAVETVQNP